MYIVDNACIHGRNLHAWEHHNIQKPCRRGTLWTRFQLAMIISLIVFFLIAIYYPNLL